MYCKNADACFYWICRIRKVRLVINLFLFIFCNNTIYKAIKQDKTSEGKKRNIIYDVIDGQQCMSRILSQNNSNQYCILYYAVYQSTKMWKGNITYLIVSTVRNEHIIYEAKMAYMTDYDFPQNKIKNKLKSISYVRTNRPCIWSKYLEK